MSPGYFYGAKVVNLLIFSALCATLCNGAMSSNCAMPCNFITLCGSVQHSRKHPRQLPLPLLLQERYGIHLAAFATAHEAELFGGGGLH